MRSLIIAPGDDAARLRAALKSGADAVVVDLAVAPDLRAKARSGAARLLAKACAVAPTLLVRVNPLGDAETDLDLDAVMPHAPFAILLPQALAPCLQQLSARLAVREADAGLEDGSTRIVAVADTAEALIGLAGARARTARLVGVAWDAEALKRDIGAETCRDEAAPMPDPGVSPATSPSSPRPRRGSRRSTRPRPAFAIRGPCGPRRSPRAATASPPSWRSIRIRRRSSTRRSAPAGDGPSPSLRRNGRVIRRPGLAHRRRHRGLRRGRVRARGGRVRRSGRGGR